MGVERPERFKRSRQKMSEENKFEHLRRANAGFLSEVGLQSIQLTKRCPNEFGRHPRIDVPENNIEHLSGP